MALLQQRPEESQESWALESTGGHAGGESGVAAASPARALAAEACAPFTVHLKGFNKGQASPGPKVTFDFIVRRGDARWQEDDRFLQNRAKAIEKYLQDLLHFIPNVEFCEVLWSFLCCVNLARSWQYGGPVCGGTPPVDSDVVAQLPRARGRPDQDEEAPVCVVCQDAMHVGSEEDDVRELPCGHLYHFRCISRWLASRNTCCMCNSSAVPTAPHLGPLIRG